MQIHYCNTIWTLSIEIAFVIQPGKTRGYVNSESVLTTLSLRLRDPFCSDNNKQEEAGNSRLKAGSDLIGCKDYLTHEV